MAVAGFVAGGISIGIMSALKGEFSLNAVLKGAAVGSKVSLAGGGALAYGVTGIALASTGAVSSGLGFGVAAWSPLVLQVSYRTGS